MRRNTPKLSLSEASPKEPWKVPAEYWTRINRQSPIQNSLYLVIDDIYGPLVARHIGGGRWKGCMGPDPDNVTHYVGFEFPK